MVTAAQAQDTYDRVRRFYKGGDKSWNKSYFGTGRQQTLQWTGWKGFAYRPNIDIEPGQVPSAKQKSRNDQTLENLKNMMDGGVAWRNAGMSPHLRGEILYNQRNTRGNCGEMAVVAMYIAVTQVGGINSDEVFEWTMTNPAANFGHSFAVLGKPGTQEWVVDPWAGVWCDRNNYQVMLTNKLGQWLTDGKRIGAAGAWVQPTNPLVAGIFNGQPQVRGFD